MIITTSKSLNSKTDNINLRFEDSPLLSFVTKKAYCTGIHVRTNKNIDYYTMTLLLKEDSEIYNIFRTVEKEMQELFSKTYSHIQPPKLLHGQFVNLGFTTNYKTQAPSTHIFNEKSELINTTDVPLNEALWVRANLDLSRFTIIVKKTEMGGYEAYFHPTVSEFKFAIVSTVKNLEF